MKLRYRKQNFLNVSDSDIDNAIYNVEFLFNKIDMTLQVSEILNLFYIDLLREQQNRKNKKSSNLIKSSIYFM